MKKGSHPDSLAPGLSAEAAVWKAPRLYVSEIDLLIVKHLPERQGVCDFLGTEELTGAISVLSLYLAKASGCESSLAFPCLAKAGRCHLAFFLAMLHSASIPKSRTFTQVWCPGRFKFGASFWGGNLGDTP